MNQLPPAGRALPLAALPAPATHNPMATDRPHAGDFSTALAAAHRGDLLDTLDDELREVIDAVRESGKKGKLVVTLSVETSKPGSDIVELEWTSKATAPKAPRTKSLFYDGDGRLHRDDPRQAKLDLREAE